MESTEGQEAVTLELSPSLWRDIEVLAAKAAVEVDTYIHEAVLERLVVDGEAIDWGDLVGDLVLESPQESPSDVPSGRMGMRKTTIRLSDRLWELIQSEAEREGITGAQYIREAVIARVFYERGARGEASQFIPGDTDGK